MYENYLFNLNEIYYGKHPLFKMIEKYFDEIRDILVIPDNYVDPFGGYKTSSNDIPDDILLDANKRKNDDTERGYVDDDDEYLQMALNRKKSINKNLEEASKFLYKSDSKYKKAHEYVKHIIRTSNISRIAISPAMILQEPTEEDFKKYGYNGVAQNLFPSIGMVGYFEPVVKYDYYVNLIKNICQAWQSIFKFPGVTLDIVIAPFVNAFYFPGMSAFKNAKIINFAKEKPIAINKWINKNRLNAFSSNNDSIYFKKYNKEPVHIFITDTTIKTLTSDMVVGLLLHEIGHSFGFELLPIEYYTNAYVQEKFADAFATKFGYGVELIRALKYLKETVDRYTVIQAYQKIHNIIPSYVTDEDLDGYLKLKIVLASLLTKYDTIEQMKGGYHDQHPSFSVRYEEQLEHLMIELNNPRLNNLQKRKLKQDIEEMKQELSPRELNKLQKFMQQEVENEINIAQQAEEYNAKLKLNPKIMRDILDKIYDQTMGNI